MKDLTQGSVARQLLGLTGFALVGMAMLMLYTLIDLYFVGTLGARAVAAVAVASNLMMVSMALGQMLGVGAGALVAQAVGAKQDDAAQRSFNQALGLGTTLALAFLFVGLLVRGWYARTFSADSESARLAADYLLWFVPAMALQFPLMVMAAALRGTGNMKPGTVAQIASVLLNIALAPVLIYGWLGAPRLGVGGAGLATFLAAIAGVVGLGFYFLLPQSFLKLRLGDFVPAPKLAWRIVAIGLPSAAEFGLMAFYLIFIIALLKPLGAAEQAAFGIGQRLLQGAMMPAMALSYAVAAVAGQNFGARLPDRVRGSFIAGLRIGVPMMLAFCLAIELWPHALIRAFSSDPEVLAAGVTFLRWIAFNLPSTGIAFTCFGVLSGLGNTLPSLLSSATRIGLIVLPATWLAQRGDFKSVWLWELSIVATLVQMLMNLLFLRRELGRKLGGPETPATSPVAALSKGSDSY